ncbi:MAG: hypothetical protein ACTSYF_02045 [Promethearchaeota archaeon]
MLFLKINGKNPRFGNEWTRKTREMQHVYLDLILCNIPVSSQLE